ncbi:MAG: P-aminobenzoate N-oxygenase AurF [Chitinophagaceae bacterium]|nr:P-aminobenzoate N-oxygenase AurF [Oligoflexus sp.]
MHAQLSQTTQISLLNDISTTKKIALNSKRNKAQDNSEELDALAERFVYADCKNEYWQQEQFSLLYGTRLWDEATESQKKLLNHLYWVAYYCQIISAEIATIYLNQAAGAGLYSVEDFRVVCDGLDLESAQERAHIACFKKISEDIEAEVFGERMFTYPMRAYHVDTMIFHNSNRVKEYWRRLQIQAYSVMSTGNAFLGCQYFTVRGLRTLNGKLVQHQLSQHVIDSKDREAMPIPSQVSFHHFLDESFHFNTSKLISHDVVKSIKAPTAFERRITNKLMLGVQKDHFNFSTAMNGIFWYDPAMYQTIFRILRSPSFGMDQAGALSMMKDCFTKENQGLHNSRKTHETAREHYRTYLDRLDFIDPEVKAMTYMGKNSIEHQLKVNQKAFRGFANGF